MEREILLIMESDGDSPIVASLTLSYNLYDEMVICLETEDYGRADGRPAERKICAVLDKDNIGHLSKRLKTSPEVLGQRLYDEFHEGGYISRTSYVRNRFKDMLEYILDLGGKYRLIDN